MYAPDSAVVFGVQAGGVRGDQVHAAPAGGCATGKLEIAVVRGADEGWRALVRGAETGVGVAALLVDDGDGLEKLDGGDGLEKPTTAGTVDPAAPRSGALPVDPHPASTPAAVTAKAAATILRRATPHPPIR